MEILLPSVYVETSIVGYATSRPSKDSIVLGRQNLTRAWWSAAQVRYRLHVSETVLEEAGDGDAEGAKERLSLIAHLPILEITPHVRTLAQRFLHDLILPPSAKGDAFHMAAATVHGMNHLATWKLKHLANADIAARLEALCRKLGWRPAQIVTLEVL